MCASAGSKAFLGVREQVVGFCEGRCDCSDKTCPEFVKGVVESDRAFVGKESGRTAFVEENGVRSFP